MGDLTAVASIAPPLLADFASLVEGCQRPLYAFLRGIVADDEAARDLIQDTFCAAWQLAQRGSPPFDAACGQKDGIRRWLFHAAYNRAISLVRRRRLISWRSLDVPASDDMVAQTTASFEDQFADAHVMRAALLMLAPADAACLLLIAAHDFTAAEVGQIVGASPQAVAKRFARAKKRLREAYLTHDPETQERLRI
ncbi:MAG TPA: sigma-70 family RNA polymerase sigma factor [Ktedonobacterales bacterium]